jgi:mono/diheme cytochrome c family protein
MNGDTRRLAYCVAATTALIGAMLPCAGCQQKMADQPSFKPLTRSEFFEDGRAARPLVAGTIARGHLRNNRAMFTGRTRDPAVERPPAGTGSPPRGPTGAATADSAPAEPPGFADDSAFVNEFPIPVSETTIVHGYQRYMIYCVVCHDSLGTGRGKIVERGYTAPPSYHIERLRDAPVGRLFAVVTEGYGSMPSYTGQIPFEDRWAIVAYVRALQLSQHFPVADLAADEREKAEKPGSGDDVDLRSVQDTRQDSVREGGK